LKIKNNAFPFSTYKNVKYIYCFKWEQLIP
jgi:hypothetical protein